MSKIRSAIYILVAIVASFTIAGSVHAARFELSPSSATFREGCNSAVNIMMSTQGAESDAANIIIHYNPAEIGIVDLNDSLPGVQIQPGSTYDIYADNIALPGDAIIRLTGFSIGHAYNSGAAFGNFGAIVFKSFAGIPSTTFTIDYVPGDTTDSNIAEYITSNDLLTGVANGSYTFEVGPCVDDVSAPWVSDPFPAPNSENVPLDSNVTFRIRDNQSGVDISSIVVEVQGVEYSRDGVNRFISAGDAMDYFITVDPIVDFPDGVIVRVEVRAQDFAGNVMAPYRWFFNQPPEPPEEPPTCEELGCPSPEECLPPEEIPECVEPEEIEIPDQTVSEEERLEPGLIEFWASRKTVRLFPDALGVVKVLFGTSYSIKFQQNILPKEADSAWWYIGQSTYQLALDTDEQTYWGDFGAYGAIAAVPAHMIINYSDGTTDVLDFTIQTVPFGSIYEITDQQETPVDNVKVTIYQLQSPAQLWNAAPYNQRNPVWTSEDGKYGFYVPRGYYYILLEKPGYEITQSPTFYARASIINNAILLERTPVVLEPLEAVAESIIQAGETVADTAERIQDAIQNTIMEALPGTEEQAEEAIGIAAPVAVGLALLNFGTAISLVNLLPLLYALFTQPLLLLGKRKRKRWGVVYNSISKVPIDLAVVRLIDLRTKKIVRTRITDREGRYFFMAKPGSYRIEVAKPGFVFPTVTLRQEKEDSQYIDLYHGEAIVVREASRQITVNIPIDPVVATERPLKLIIYFYLRKIQMAVASISILLALGLLMVNPSWLMLVYFVAQVAIFALFWRLAKPKKPKGWGIVYDRNTKKPLANAIVRIFDHKFNRLLEAQVTDSKGRYSFLVGSNKYFTTYEKPGYRTKKLSPIDYSGREEGTLVNYDVGLDKDKRPKKLRSERPDDHKSAGQINISALPAEKSWTQEEPGTMEPGTVEGETSGKTKNEE